MNKQEIFDKVAKHLLTQNKCSKSKGDDTCVYRNEEGLKCAVGCLIPEEEYSTKFEYTTIDGLLDRKDCPRSLLKIKEHREFLQDLQQIHDTCAVSAWKRELRGLAKEEHLDWKIEE